MARRRLPRQPEGRPKPKRTPESDAEKIAALYVHAQAALVGAGRALHDHVGSSLAAVGVQLQLLRMDVPAAQAQVDETLLILEEVLNRIRGLSQDLCPSPAYRGGLKQALMRLAGHNASGGCFIEVEYSATSTVSAEITVALYEAVQGVVEQAVREGAAHVSITARGSSGLVLRVADDGRKSGRARALSTIGTLAHAQGLAIECTTGKGTIVSIRYATRRPTRR
jgi:signal transduction histidine kinase